MAAQGGLTTRGLVAALLQKLALQSCYQPDIPSVKAGVILLDLSGQAVQQLVLPWDGAAPQRSRDALMQAVDQLNHRYGAGAVHVGSTGSAAMGQAAWHMLHATRSPHYTTQLNGIPHVRAV